MLGISEGKSKEDGHELGWSERNDTAVDLRETFLEFYGVKTFNQNCPQMPNVT